ncbi:MAG: response regulator [Chitinispirillales bacterium]|jgi:YesN/AraC family two-component response regulator|nr:response regulator [Chitinispirillales bacterium]
MYKVLFVDDEDFIRDMLFEYFREQFEVVTVENASAGLNVLSNGGFDLVVSDINMPGMKGPQFLAEVHRLYPTVKTALLTCLNIDEYITLARENSISSIIPKTAPFNFNEIELILQGLLSGEIFGISRFLRLEDGIISNKYCIKSSAESRDVREKIVTELEERFKSSGDTRLILDEILSNAIYHAPAKEEGSEKYAQFTEVELEPSEYIYAQVGYDSEKYAVSVLDMQGRLTRDVVLSKMERQITGAGVLDDSGRGLHMSRLFADRMVINIERNKRTEVIIMNYLSGKYRGYKPLYINEI